MQLKVELERRRPKLHIANVANGGPLNSASLGYELVVVAERCGLCFEEVTL